MADLMYLSILMALVLVTAGLVVLLDRGEEGT